MSAAELMAEPWRVYGTMRGEWVAVREEALPGRLLGFVRVKGQGLRLGLPVLVIVAGHAECVVLRDWYDTRRPGRAIYELSIATRQPIEWWRGVADFAEASQNTGDDHATT